MALTINDAHTELSYRLGESSVPSSASELAKRQNWFEKAISIVCKSRDNFWFMQKLATDRTEANIDAYDLPTRCKKIIQVKVDDYKYDEIDFKEVYDKFEVPSYPVPILSSDLERRFYIWDEQFYLIPMPSSAPTSNSVTALTSSGTTCTATVSSHGYATGDRVTIEGASPTTYNGTFRIIVSDDDTFTYTASSTPASSPATGTITATKENIKIWHYEYPNLTGLTSSSSIIIPDDYIDILVSYAEARYWSMAHKRGKSADAFSEFQELHNQLRADNFHKKFLAND